MQRQLGGRDLSVSVFKVEGVTIKSEQSTQLQLVQQKNTLSGSLQEDKKQKLVFLSVRIKPHFLTHFGNPNFRCEIPADDQRAGTSLL